MENNMTEDFKRLSAEIVLLIKDSRLVGKATIFEGFDKAHAMLVELKELHDSRLED